MENVIFEHSETFVDSFDCDDNDSSDDEHADYNVRKKRILANM